MLSKMDIKDRFRGYLPVILDLETGGFNNLVNPVLEIACSFVKMGSGQLEIDSEFCWPVSPFPGSTIESSSLKVTGIDPNDPERNQLDEKTAFNDFFKIVRSKIKFHGCTRAIAVAHNASFDHGFIQSACERSQIKRNPFHPFSTIDTASLAAVAYGHTVLSESCARAGLAFDDSKAHSAAYDANRTAELFCTIVNNSSFELVTAKD